MIANCNISLSLEISTLIAIGLLILVFGISFIYRKCKKKNSDYCVTSFDVSASPSAVYSLDNSDRQIAYKVWVDINTRTIAVKIDLEKDNIKVINDSYHSCFCSTRELIKEIPVTKLNKSKDLLILLTDFLNNILRPYLTKWGVIYKDWYESAQLENVKASHDDKKKYKTFIKLQKEFPQYDELTKDLLEINNKVVHFSDKLYQIAFKTNDKKNKKAKKEKKSKKQ